MLLEGAADPPDCGGTPWSIPCPLIVDTAAARRELGYGAATTYAESVATTFS